MRAKRAADRASMYATAVRPCESGHPYASAAVGCASVMRRRFYATWRAFVEGLGGGAHVHRALVALWHVLFLHHHQPPASYGWSGEALASVQRLRCQWDMQGVLLFWIPPTTPLLSRPPDGCSAGTLG